LSLQEGEEADLGRLAARGQPLHTRSLTLVLRAAPEGGALVRGDIIDLRKTGFVPMPDGIQPAGIIHHMLIEARVSADRTLEELETSQPAVAVEPSALSGGECCRDPAPRLQALVGRRFDTEFAAALSKNFGGALGCSHLLTLFHLLASALPLAFEEEAAVLRESAAARRAGEWFFRRSVFVDGYEPEEGALQLAVQLADFHSRPEAAAANRLDHFAGQREVRVGCDIDLGKVGIRTLSALERTRTRDTLGSARWRDSSARLARFVGRPVMPGLGAALRGEFGSENESRLLLDALLQLAPGFVQCMPALTDRMVAQLARKPGGASGEGRRPIPDFLALGGATDSCYMWRAGGPLLQVRAPED